MSEVYNKCELWGEGGKQGNSCMLKLKPIERKHYVAVTRTAA
jgi:hypothetical protein